MDTNISILVGALVPLLVSVIVQPSWSKKSRQVLAVVVALAVGVINVLVQDSFHGLGDALAALAVVVGSAQAAYALVWNRIGVTDVIEKATTLPS